MYVYCLLPAVEEAERASNTTITVGKEFALHGFCMVYFISLAFYAVFSLTRFTCN